MRLLTLNARGEIGLEKDFLHNIPSYAILSHTWGPQDEEVTFEDLGKGRRKAGWEKIQFCAEQARKDGLQYFWVDTCCIDKTNSTELSESITSMFRWYRQAERCYVYLSDVSSNKRDNSGSFHRTWEPSFKRSRWFTRGWTLQELLAPASVEFFSREGQLLGSKSSLASLIQGITAIPVAALLHGTPLSAFDVYERIEWTAARETTKPEDRAYCLQGIFDVFIPPMYGERDNAWHRLIHAINEKHGTRLNDVESPAAQRNAPAPGSAVHVTGSHRSSSPARRDVLSKQEIDELLNFIGFEQMDSRRSTIKSAYSTTCAWLLKSQMYMDWIDPAKFDQHSGFLWIKGKPGAGKSTIVKFAHTQATRSPGNGEILVSYFFNARGDLLEKSTIGMYRSLLYQILQKSSELQKVLDDTIFGDAPLNVLRAPGFTWTIEVLRVLLESVVRSLKSQRLKCFIDALDECDEHEIRDMIQHFEDLAQVSRGSFYVCFASRHYPSIDIRYGIQLILEDESGHKDDLTKYVLSHLRIGKGRNLNGIKTQLQAKANGVFMWVVLVIDILNEEFRRGRIFAVQKRLDEIPEKLSDLFKEILRRDTTNLDDLLLCIQWVLFARKPLELRQFYYAMVAGLSSDSTAEWDPENVSDATMESYLLDCSKGLAELTKAKKSPKVQFIHESVRDFLIKDNGLYELWPELQNNIEGVGHRQLSRCCQKYLGLDLETCLPEASPAASVGHREEVQRSLSRKFPFLTYAMEQVFYHANKAAESMEEFPAALDFNEWNIVANTIDQLQVCQRTDETPLLYLLAEQDCSHLIKHFHQHNMTVPWISDRKGRHRCPFAVAIAKKHWHVIQALLEPSSDARVKEVVERLAAKQGGVLGSTSTAYLWALRNGHVIFAEMLIAISYTNTSPNRAEKRRAFASAAGYGQKESIVHFLSTGETDFNKALQTASSNGHQEVVRMLLDAGADVNAQGDYYGNALQAACRNGHQEVVRILLDAGADVNARGGIYDNALCAASCRGDQVVVKILLDAGADVNARGGRFGIALQAASRNGHQEAVKLLLDAGADVNERGSYDNALYGASSIGSQEVVKLLLDAGADVNVQGGYYGNVLQAVSSRGSQEVVKLLLDAGADVNVQGGYYGNALQAASSNGRQEIVKILLDAGADVNAQGGFYGNAFQGAYRNDHQQVLQILVKAGAQGVT